MDYVLRSNEFGAEPVPEIELTRVEVWDGSVVPAKLVAMVNPASGEYINQSDVGWTNWGGTLYLPSWVHSIVDGHEADYLLRVYGYSPYAPLTDDEDVSTISNELQWALVTYAQVEAYERLNNDRTLFTQWQTRSGNTDISPAGLMNMLSLSRENWRRKSHAILRLRSQS